jgi:hypothetical protein
VADAELSELRSVRQRVATELGAALAGLQDAVGVGAGGAPATGAGATG